MSLLVQLVNPLLPLLVHQVPLMLVKTLFWYRCPVKLKNPILVHLNSLAMPGFFNSKYRFVGFMLVLFMYRYTRCSGTVGWIFYFWFLGGVT